MSKKGLLTFKRLLLPLELTLSQKQGGKFLNRAEADVSNQYHYFSDTQLLVEIFEFKVDLVSKSLNKNIDNIIKACLVIRRKINSSG